MSEPKRYHHQAGLRSREVIDTGEDRDLNIMFADAYYEADAKRLCDRMNGYEDTIARLKAEVERLKEEPDALTAYLYADTLRREDIKTLKAHIERLTKAGEWQPIETAPANGEAILGYRQGNVFVIHRYFGNLGYQLTHWMPLPSAPAKEGKQP